MSLHFIFLNCTASGMISVARSDMIFQAQCVLFIYAFSRQNLKSRVNVCWWNGRVAVRLEFSWTDENWVEHSWQWGSYWWPGRRDWDLNVLNSKINDLHLGNSAGSFKCNLNEGSGINVTWDAERALCCVQCVLSIAVSQLHFHLLYILNSYLFIIPLTPWWELWISEPSKNLNCI